MYRKYDKIKNKGLHLSDFAESGFVVEQKLDGANASFTYDKHAGKLRAFSRNTELSESNTLNGFYNYVSETIQELVDSSDFVKDKLSENTIFGEWLTPHKVKYKEEAYNKFYAFDLCNKETGNYISYGEKMSIFETLNLNTVEVFNIYTPSDIELRNSQEILDEIQSYVGKSNLTQKPDEGEGVVIKRLTGKAESDEYYKLVSDRFKEIKGTKKDKPVNGAVHIVDYAITSQRLEKLIHKKLDEQELVEEDLSLQNFGKVMKTVAPDFMEDVLEEEMDMLIKQIKQRIGRQLPNILRPYLESKDREDSDI